MEINFSSIKEAIEVQVPATVKCVHPTYNFFLTKTRQGGIQSNQRAEQQGASLARTILTEAEQH